MHKYKFFNKIFRSIVIESEFYIVKCYDCVHYKNLKCGKFNNLAILSRLDQTKCGLEGKYYKQKYFILSKNIKLT
jgi:hypothetical protein